MQFPDILGAPLSEASLSNDLPTILATLRQQRADGELVLEHNDGTRRLYWRKGELVYLHSDVAGEQFGNYLLRQGVIDLAGLNQLLAKDTRYRLGEKVVQWGLMTVEDRDAHLCRLQEQVMVNALEHPIIHLAWNPGSLDARLSEDLDLKLDHRRFIWNTFQEAHHLQPTCDHLRGHLDWSWEGIPRLLEQVSDLPLTPADAYAISFLGPEPIGFETFLVLSGLGEDEAARLFLSLWAVGALVMTQGQLPPLVAAGAEPDGPVTPPSIAPPVSAWPDPAGAEPAAPGGPEPDDPRLEPDFAGSCTPEFLDVEDPDGTESLAGNASPAGPRPRDPEVSPAGPVPARVEQSPAGPRPAGLDVSPARPLPPWPDLPPVVPLPVRDEPIAPTGARPGGLDVSPAGPLPAWPSFPPVAPLPLRGDPFTGEPRLEPAPPPGLDPFPSGPPPLPPDLNLPPAAPLSPLERARGLHQKARQLHYKGHTGEAIHALELAVQLDPASTEAYAVWVLLGQLRMSNPAWATRSINAFQAAARIRPKAANPWIAMGQIYLRKGFQGNAVACFHKALELDPAVEFPPDVDLRKLEEEQLVEPPPAPSLLCRFKALFKGKIS
jgi:hypothetical protein